MPTALTAIGVAVFTVNVLIFLGLVLVARLAYTTSLEIHRDKLDAEYASREAQQAATRATHTPRPGRRAAPDDTAVLPDVT
jgi:hypothetical protein